MGVRFACHACDKRLNIKQELAGRRGVCPSCGTRFRIPAADAEKSTPLESDIPPQRAVASEDAWPDEDPLETIVEPAPAVSSQPSARPDSEPAAPARPQLPDPFSDATITTWYVRPPSGGQYGPATGEILRQWVSEGRVAATSLLWREGWPQWREAHAVVPELARGLPLASGTIGGAKVSELVEAQHTGSLLAASPHRSAAAINGQSVVHEAESLSGDAEIGRQKRAKSLRRTLAIAVLSLLSVGLVVVLVMVLSGSR